MVQRTRIPILLLTGFLGSGKTSLLGKWLRAPAFAGSMVIVNELGEVGLDDRLVQFSSEAPVLLENGCACCQAAEDLNATLERLFWARLHRQIPRFEWMLIETTGVADPAPIIAALGRNEVTRERYRVAGVIATLDARLGPGQIARHPECRSQIMQADAVILTKLDLATAAQAEEAAATVKALRPDAAILRSAHAGLGAAEIVASLPKDERDTPPEPAEAQHSPDVTSAFAALPAATERDVLEAALRQTLERYGARVLRIKGAAILRGETAAHAIQIEPGLALQSSPLGAVPDRLGLTIIAQYVPASQIARDLLARLPAPADAAAPSFPRQARA